MRETLERAFSRLSRVPRFLRQAADNIETVPEAYYQASLHMIDDCRRYLSDICKSSMTSPGMNASGFGKLARAAQDSLSSFRRFLNDLRPSPDRMFAGRTLERTLTQHFQCARSLDEIFQIAEESWMENLARLEELRIRIDPGSSWQQIYREYDLPPTGRSNTLSLYAREIENLRSFFVRQGFDSRALNAALEISETPAYLRSVRGSASFAAAHTSDAAEKSFFYITTRLAQRTDRQEQKLLTKRFHREYRLLTAHEAIPGHHYLDAVRRQLTNPVRRQIESPLFYEGWASYAESLLAEYGYAQSPLEQLIDSKRNLWRSARCQIDVGLSTGRINPSDAHELLAACGFSVAEARRQLDRFRLNPGYQLCYSLGKYEFERLQTAFAAKLGRRRFFGHLLEGGELPFDSTHARLARICSDRNGD